jgi:hypothetical protein
MQKLLLFILACITLVSPASAQSREKMVGLISNGSTREWKFKDYKAELGSSGSCSYSGQLYIFSSSGTLELKRCVNNKEISSTMSWDLKDLGHGEWQIVFGSPLPIADAPAIDTIRVDFPNGKKNKSGITMIWRVVADSRHTEEQLVKLISRN